MVRFTPRQQSALKASSFVLGGTLLVTGCSQSNSTPAPSRSSSPSEPSPQTTSADPRDTAALPIALPSFEDDFSFESQQGKLDDRFWKVYDGEATPGTGGEWSKDLVSVGGGVLTLKGSGNQVAALCFCGVGTPDFSYGDYEARIRMTPGAGFAINGEMLWPGSNDWPKDGEVNAAEVTRADRGAASVTNHWEEQGAPAQTNEAPIAKDFTQWVNVKIEWRPDRITVLWDNVKIFETTEHIPKNPMQIVFQIDAARPDGKWGDVAADPQNATTSLEVKAVKFSPILGVSTVPGETGEMAIGLAPNSPGRELSIQTR